jgi:hypothetical protein
MAAALLATLALLAAAALAGTAVCRLGGLAGPRGSAPAVGLALLMAVAAPAARLPGGAAIALGTIAIVAVAALAARPVRATLRAGLPGGAAVTLAALALLSLPWLAAGHFGVLGMGVNNDTATHLVAARWLLDRGIPAADTLVGAGYPLGPHALAAALASAGVPLVSAFTAVALAGSVVAALAALDGIRVRPRTLRWALALVAGLTYMSVAYFVQLAFKETIEAALSLAFALLLGPAGRVARGGPRAAARAALPLAVLLAGTVQTMSWPGAIWPLATLAGWLVLVARAQRRPLRGWLAAARPALQSGAAALALLLSLELPRVVAFQGSPYAHEPDQGTGNLEGVIPPYRALGVWLGPDFRFSTHLPLLTAALLVAAAGLIGLGVLAWVRRGERALVAAMAGGWLVWAVLSLTKNGYNATKALPVLAPVVGLALVTGAVTAWSRVAVAARRPAGAAAIHYAALLPPLPRAAQRGAALAAVAVVLGAVALSSLWALRGGVAGVDAHARELRSLAAVAPPGPMLVLHNSDFAAWDLYGVEIWRPPLIYPVHTVPTRPQKRSPGRPFDLDSVSTADLNRFASVLTSRTAAGSAPQAGLRVLRRTPSFVLWQRVGTLPEHGTLREGWLPGATLDCSTTAGRALSRRAGWAVVRPRPVVADAAGWHGTARDAGSSASRTLRLPPGRWDLSLQYVSRNPIEVRAGGATTVLPANLDRLGSLFAAGITGGGRREVRIRVAAPGGIARLLGATPTRALSSPGNQPLGALVATRHGAAPRRIPLARACGRYVDSYTLR